MSLTGSLGELGLCDLLQILGLAGKSGLLELQATEGEGWVLFSGGQVAGAWAKGGPPDLSALLRAHGHDAEAPLGAEELESLRRGAAEAAVVGMLGWGEGSFQFGAADAEERVASTGLRLATPIPSQYLALEGARMQDEEGAGAEEAPPETPEIEAAPQIPAEPLLPLAAGDATGPLPYPLVVVDPVLGALEWLKSCLAESFAHVHIFQSTDLGLTRIRQYLARGELPIVLLARHAKADALSGIRDAAELVSRLEHQAPRMPIVLLVERDGIPAAAPAAPGRGVVGLVSRPSLDWLADPRLAAEAAESAEALRTALVSLLRGARRS